jgi:hypothetical protein
MVEIVMVETFSGLIEYLATPNLPVRESIKSGKASNRTHIEGGS